MKTRYQESDGIVKAEGLGDGRVAAISAAPFAGWKPATQTIAKLRLTLPPAGPGHWGTHKRQSHRLHGVSPVFPMPSGGA